MPELTGKQQAGLMPQRRSQGSLQNLLGQVLRQELYSDRLGARQEQQVAMQQQKSQEARVRRLGERAESYIWGQESPEARLRVIDELERDPRMSFALNFIGRDLETLRRVVKAGPTPEEETAEAVEEAERKIAVARETVEEREDLLRDEAEIWRIKAERQAEAGVLREEALSKSEVLKEAERLEKEAEARITYQSAYPDFQRSLLEVKGFMDGLDKAALEKMTPYELLNKTSIGRSGAIRKMFESYHLHGDKEKRERERQAFLLLLNSLQDGEVSREDQAAFDKTLSFLETRADNAGYPSPYFDLVKMYLDHPVKSRNLSKAFVQFLWNISPVGMTVKGVKGLVEHRRSLE